MTELIKRVSVLNNKTEIDFEDKIVNKETKSTRKKFNHVIDDEQRHPDFSAAADEVGSFLPAMFGFPEEWEVEFKGLTINRQHGFVVMINAYAKFNVEGITTGTQMSLGPLYQESKDGNNQLSLKMYDAIIAFLVEAEAYAMRDKKAQLSLLDDDNAEKTDEELDEEEKLQIATPPGTKKAKGKRTLKGALRAFSNAEQSMASQQVHGHA